MEFPKLYYESLVNYKLKEVLEDWPRRVRHGKDIKFTDRSCFHMFGRVLYRFIRIFYVSFIYYFIPYSILVVHWLTPDKFVEESGAAEGGE